MTIAIDARMLKWTGIGRYTRQLLNELQELDTQNKYLVLMRKKDWDDWEPAATNFTKVVADFKPYSFGEQLGFWRLLRKLNPDLVHFPNFNAPVLYFGRRAYTIPDLTLINYKTNQGDGLSALKYEIKYWAMRFAMRHAVMTGKALLTYTETVKNELIRHYRRPALGAKTTAVALAVDALNAVEPVKPAVDLDTFLLYVGNFYPNKNIGRFIEAFAKLGQDMPNLKLVIVGKADYFQKQLRNQAERLGMADRVIFTGFIDDSELVWLYQNAALFVFPSLSEGFGLPPLEAMAAGTPVISSNASCMPEVLGEAAAYFDPMDPSDMAHKIGGLLDDPKELDRLRQAGAEQVKKYSWRKMAQETLDVYKSVLEN